MEVAHPELHEGISIWDDLEVARDKMASAKSVEYIAEVEIPDGVGIVKQTPQNPHHYTWWVDPKDALTTVTGVMTKE